MRLYRKDGKIICHIIERRGLYYWRSGSPIDKIFLVREFRTLADAEERAQGCVDGNPFCW